MEATDKPKARIEWITRYRGFLITLVILIHVSITYGATGGWYYSEEHEVEWLKILGTLLCSIAQSFVLGAFFFISSYFLPEQARRKGLGSVLAEKALRLGLPFLAYFFIFNSLAVLAAENLGRGAKLPLRVYAGSGPLWFAEALLIFTAAWILYARRKPSATAPAPGEGPVGRPRAGAIGAFMLLAGTAGFAVRLAYPVGRSISNLQLGFFPMYIAWFCLGAQAGRKRWLEGAGELRARWWLASAAILAAAFPLAVVAGGGEGPEAFLGGWTWQAAAYAYWEAAIGTCLLVATLILFARRGASPRRGPFLSYSEASFGVYQLHGPVIVAAAALMKGPWAHPALKYLLLAAMGTLLPWALTAALRRIRALRSFL